MLTCSYSSKELIWNQLLSGELDPAAFQEPEDDAGALGCLSASRDWRAACQEEHVTITENKIMETLGLRATLMSET